MKTKADQPRIGGRYIRDPKTGERVPETETVQSDKSPKPAAKTKAEKD